ncbi:MAG TPA: glycosyltransferase family 4 protein [Gemmatimonadales bacterium]
MTAQPGPPRDLRIEMVLPSMPTAGMEVMVARMVRGLLARGHHVGVTCIESRGELGEELADEGVRVMLVPTPGLATILRAPALDAWLARSGADVVHVHSGAWLKASGAARRAGLPSVATVHGLLAPEPWHGPPLMHWAGRRTHTVVAVTASLADYLNRVARIPRHRLVVIPNGIGTDAFTPGGYSGAVRGRIGIADGAPLVGHVARLDDVKNQPLLLEAFALARRHVPDAMLAIVGEGAMRPALEERIDALGLRGVAHLLGAERDVAPVYRDFDLFVLSSRTEGTSMSMLEAMSTGVACVATAVGGNPALLDHGRAGLLTPADDAAALGDAMATLLLDRRRRAELAAAGRARVMESYGDGAMLDAYTALYERLLPARGGRNDQPRTEACVA